MKRLGWLQVVAGFRNPEARDPVSHARFYYQGGDKGIRKPRLQLVLCSSPLNPSPTPRLQIQDHGELPSKRKKLEAGIPPSDQSISFSKTLVQIIVLFEISLPLASFCASYSVNGKS